MSGGCGGSWGNGARAKSVNHSISKINGVFWSSLPFVSAEWPEQRRAARLQRRILPLWMADNEAAAPGLVTFASTCRPDVKRAGCQTRPLVRPQLNQSKKNNSRMPVTMPSRLDFHPQNRFSPAHY